MCISSDLSLSFYHFSSSAVVLSSLFSHCLPLFVVTFLFLSLFFFWFVSFVWMSVDPFFPFSSIFVSFLFSAFVLPPFIVLSSPPQPSLSLSPSHQSLHKLFWGRKQQKGEERWELEGQEFFRVKLSGSVMHENTLSDMITHPLL